MPRSVIDDAFGHHVWAAVRLIDACLSLSPDQLETVVPGTYGSILDTQRHVVGSDSWYLFTLNGDRSFLIDEDHADLSELRSAMERNGPGWSRLLAQGLDPEAVLVEKDDDDGYQKHAPIGIRLAQAIHHGTDHRSQICTALTNLGLQPPAIDAWDFGLDDGRVAEVSPPT
ncbi:MAG TPA: DinB family protein [Acidimicrobiia bacterium]|nr:DinB family protein [Acidimicrobiia bacterium]